MIRAIFFDFDGVLTTDDGGGITIVNNLHDETGISKDALKAGAKAEESAYIDNHESKLVRAREMGFKTYFHDCEKNDVEALKKQLELWGVKL